MAPSNKIWTLKDVTNGIPSLSPDGSENENDNNNNPDKIDHNSSTYNPLSAGYCQPAKPGTVSDSLSKLCHLPNLPKSDICEATLKRIQQEFEPLVRQRGYNVLSVSEMCCCGDGLDHDVLPGGRKRTKRRKQNANVLGYNQTTFGRRRKRSHTIHLRLRDPHDHTTLLSWEDVAGTMAHELSHCVHQNHQPPFFKLMEEILEQHATMQVTSIGWRPRALNGRAIQDQRNNNNNNNNTGNIVPAATPSFPAEGGQRLGGSKLKGRQIPGTDPQQGSESIWGTGKPLGGGGGGGGRSRLSAREAAARAAECRRRQLDRVRKMVEKSKQPCVIDLLDDDDDDDGVAVETATGKVPTNGKTQRKNGTKQNPSRPKDEKNNFPRHEDRKRPPGERSQQSRRAKPPPVAKKSKQEENFPSRAPAVIDLTEEEDEVDMTTVHPGSVQGNAPKPTRSEGGWSCGSCTFRNEPLALVCSICQGRRLVKRGG